MISNRQDWKIRIVRTIRSHSLQLLRYPFVGRWIEVSAHSRQAKKTWVAAGYLDVIVRKVNQPSVSTTFVRLFESQIIQIPDVVDQYWLRMRPKPWITDLTITVSEFVGVIPREMAVIEEQLDRMETKIDRLDL